MQRNIHLRRTYSLPKAVITLLESEYNCTKVMYRLERSNPYVMAKESYSFSGGCSFFPELDEQTEAFAFELYRNTSQGLAPTEKDFWEDENAAENYCKWLVQKLTDPEWMEAELYRNTSRGLAPMEKDFWEDKNAAENYCEWLVEKLTDPEWMEAESNHHFTSTFLTCILIITGSTLVATVVGFILGKRKPHEKWSTVAYHVFNVRGMFK
uniref:CX domain-containing protein n=1 Tax=Steinernema glaseri TaxID=37863 RepID=A0A1I8AJL4_9BILA